MRCWKNIIKSDNPKNPRKSPAQTCAGLWRLSFRRAERTSPPTITTGTKYRSNGVNILRERINTRLISAPAPTEWSDIFHRKLTIVTMSEMKAAEKINDFKNTGIGNLNTINEVVQ
jgi:hypothetical protein